MNWEPFSTAPEDGTVVDLWTKHGRRMADMQWLRGERRDRACERLGALEHLAADGWNKVGCTNGTEVYNAEQFTHWMKISGPT